MTIQDAQNYQPGDNSDIYGDATMTIADLKHLQAYKQDSEQYKPNSRCGETQMEIAVLDPDRTEAEMSPSGQGWTRRTNTLIGGQGIGDDDLCLSIEKLKDNKINMSTSAFNLKDYDTGAVSQGVQVDSSESMRKEVIMASASQHERDERFLVPGTREKGNDPYGTNQTTFSPNSLLKLMKGRNSMAKSPVSLCKSPKLVTKIAHASGKSTEIEKAFYSRPI